MTGQRRGAHCLHSERAVPRCGRGVLALVVLLVAAGACGRENEIPQNARPLPPIGVLERIPLGRVPGPAVSVLASEIRNPYAGDAAAQQAGDVLFGQMNCVYCHGYDAQGAIGPDLTDAAWRYGGTPAEVFKSTYEGRPKGMPAYGAVLTEASVWQIVAYLQTLGGVSRQGDRAPGGEGRSMSTLKGDQLGPELSP